MPIQSLLSTQQIRVNQRIKELSISLSFSLSLSFPFQMSKYILNEKKIKIPVHKAFLISTSLHFILELYASFTLHLQVPARPHVHTCTLSLLNHWICSFLFWKCFFPLPFVSVISQKLVVFKTQHGHHLSWASRCPLNTPQHPVGPFPQHFSHGMVATYLCFLHRVKTQWSNDCTLTSAHGIAPDMK